MTSIDQVATPHALTVSTLVTVIVAGWFALTFAFTVGGLLVGA